MLDKNIEAQTIAPTMFWKGGTTWSTEMDGNARPMIPSNLAAMNAIPGSWVTYVCVCACVYVYAYVYVCLF